MTVKVRLLNHGYVDGVYRHGGDIVEIDESKFTETWMQKIEVVPPKPEKKGIVKRIFGKS